MFALYFEFDVLLLLIWNLSHPCCLQRLPASFFNFANQKWCCFFGSMWYFFGEDAAGGNGIDSGSVS